jgi:hypothetical protein
MKVEWSIFISFLLKSSSFDATLLNFDANIYRSLKQHPNGRIFPMRKAMLFLVVFGLVGLLYAADPAVGTWKLNIAKSKISSSAEGIPKEGTIVVRELGADEFKLTFSEVMSNGSKTSLKATWPQKGGVLKSSAPAKGESSVVTMIAPGEWYTTTMQNGKQNELLHSFISKDGKTMNVQVKGMDDQGKPFETLSVYDKQ